MSPSAKNTGPQLVLRFCGGNAYVFTDKNRRVHIGPVKKPDGARGFNEHRMFLKRAVGAVEEIRGYPPPPSRGEYSWSLTGFIIELRPDGKRNRRPGLTTSPTSPPPDPCGQADAAPSSPVDNLFYLPNLLDLHPSARLRQGWQRRLGNRIVLDQGRLSVDHVMHCYSFRSRGTSQGDLPSQSLADGRAAEYAGVRYGVPVQRHLDVFFLKQVRTTTRIVGALRFLPVGSEIVLDITVDERPIKPRPGRELAEFQQFYELLSGIPRSQRRRLIFEHASHPVAHCPGSECGGFRIAER